MREQAYSLATRFTLLNSYQRSILENEGTEFIIQMKYLDDMKQAYIRRREKARRKDNPFVSAVVTDLHTYNLIVIMNGFNKTGTLQM